ncbi:J domain-containing protein [Sporomusa sp.]|uniref:J domain-containing protein n=1 Tax=Sporomusa sp. TaxID=2078658 RepID=UPI002B60220D|nr:J domain-containing protein [Sporomusa sp.]HWR44109.1 J domain-containing protein [Sporomusa sp.]
MKYIDYYEVLGIPRTASDKDIKQAYRQLARQHHPDLHQGDAKQAAEEKFKAINEAYEVLGDPEKRGKYDQLGRNWQTGQDFEPAGTGFSYSVHNTADFDLGGFGFSDFFSSMFGQDFSHRQAGRPTSFKGEDIDAEISLSIEELLNGVEKDLHLTTPNACSACAGRRFTRQGVCPVCGGLGTTEETKTVKVKIPPGLHPGASLRLKGLGGQGHGGGASGDLYLHIKATPHPSWQLANKADLTMELTLLPEQAVLGAKIPIATPHGQLQVKVQPGIRSGQQLRLKGKGLPQGPNRNGDLFLKIRIDIPTNLTEEELELYRQIQKLKAPTPGN